MDFAQSQEIWAGTKSNMKRAIVVARKAEDAEVNLTMLEFRRGDGDI